MKKTVTSLEVILIGGSVIWGVFERFFHLRYSIEAIIAISYLASLVLVLLIFLIVQEYRLSRKARYAEIIEHQSSISQIVREATAKDLSREQLIDAFISILDELAEAFGLLTATRCAACLKVLVYDQRQPGSNREPLTETVCRNKISASKRAQPVKQTRHWVSENTDFQLIHTAFPGPDAYFFSNDLTRFSGYRNTSATQLSHVTVNPTTTGWFRRLLFWPLPYKSTIVVPVWSRDREAHEYLRGYLCVDSRSRNVFDQRFDLELMHSVASLLGPVFEKVYQSTWSNHSTEEINANRAST